MSVESEDSKANSYTLDSGVGIWTWGNSIPQDPPSTPTPDHFPLWGIQACLGVTTLAQCLPT